MRQCEFKKRYDPNLDIYVTKHIQLFHLTLSD